MPRYYFFFTQKNILQILSVFYSPICYLFNLEVKKNIFEFLFWWDKNYILSILFLKLFICDEKFAGFDEICRPQCD